MEKELVKKIRKPRMNIMKMILKIENNWFFKNNNEEWSIYYIYFIFITSKFFLNLFCELALQSINKKLLKFSLFTYIYIYFIFYYMIFFLFYIFTESYMNRNNSSTLQTLPSYNFI